MLIFKVNNHNKIIILKQNVYIANFKELYEIFNEIKSALNFNVFEINDLDLQNFIKLNNKNLKYSLIITSHKKTNFKIKTIDSKEVLIFENLPISLNSLIEKINIFLLKLKYRSQSEIIIKNYVINLNNRKIYNRSTNTKLTEKEIQLILFLFYEEIPQKVSKLQSEIWNYANNLDTHTVETHIYRLRKKIENVFGDDNFILSSEKGYHL